MRESAACPTLAAADPFSDPQAVPRIAAQPLSEDRPSLFRAPRPEFGLRPTRAERRPHGVLRRAALLLLCLGALLATTPVVTGAAASPSAPRTVADTAPTRTLTLDTDLRRPSGIAAWSIDAFLAANTPLPPLGAAFKAAEARYHVNALYLLAHAMHESGFGRSYLAQHKHNLFGWNAADRNPGRLATSFASYAEAINIVAAGISQRYLTPGGIYYGGAPTLRGMRHYATDPNWGPSIVSIARSMNLPTLRGRGIAFVTHGSSEALTTNGTTTLVIRAAPAGALPNGLRLAARVRQIATAAFHPVVSGGGQATEASDGQDPAADVADLVPVRVRSRDGSFKVPIEVGPNPGRFRVDFEVLDSDGKALTQANAVPIPATILDVAARFDVAFSAEIATGVTLHVANVGAIAVPAVGPGVGTIEAGRPTTMLTTWLVRAGQLAVALPSQVLPADLVPGDTWDTGLDLGALVLQPGDVLVARIEVPDPDGFAQRTIAGVLEAALAPVPLGREAPRPDGAAAALALAPLAADDVVALAAVGLIAPTPLVDSAVAAVGVVLTALPTAALSVGVAGVGAHSGAPVATQAAALLPVAPVPTS